MASNDAEGATPRVQEPIFVCDFCGPDHPANRVFQCTICLKDFCVTHIGTWAHDCYQNE